jgi:hypothetical protein
MVAYFDDWLLFGANLLSQDILAAIELGFTINYQKSVTQPMQNWTYLGL